MIKVSIIVAAYNVENYIERCMDSLVNQTLSDIEIVVVNDGSTDSTLNILKGYNERDNRIIIVDKNNAGLIEARKSGLAESNGKYLLFVDGDDWIDTKTAEILYNKAKKDKLDIVCYNLCHAYDTWIKNMDMYDFGIVSDLEYLRLVLLNKVRANIVLQFLNREFVINNNIEFPSNITYAEDLAITVTLACNEPKVGSLYETLYYYYQRENSVTQQVSEKVFDVEIAINIIEEALKNKSLYEVYYNEFQYLMFIHLYYHRVIAVRYLGEIHKELYDKWVIKRVSLKENQYYREFIKTIPFKERFKIELYNINYTLGNMYNRMYNFMIKLLKR